MSNRRNELARVNLYMMCCLVLVTEVACDEGHEQMSFTTQVSGSLMPSNSLTGNTIIMDGLSEAPKLECATEQALSPDELHEIANRATPRLSIRRRLFLAQTMRAEEERVALERAYRETTVEDARVDETFEMRLPDEATLARQRAWFARNAIDVPDAYARRVGVDAETVRRAESWYDAEPGEIVAALASGRIGVDEVEWIYERANARPDNGAKFELLSNIGPMPEAPPAQRRRD